MVWKTCVPTCNVINSSKPGWSLTTLRSGNAFVCWLDDRDGNYYSIYANCFERENGVICPIVVQDFAARIMGEAIEISWQLSAASLASLAGVHVEKAAEPLGPYLRMTAVPLLPDPSMSFRAEWPSDAGTCFFRLVLLDNQGRSEVVGPLRVDPAELGRATLALFQPMAPADGGPVRINYVVGSVRHPVELGVFSVTGRRVRRFDLGWRGAGSYSLHWDRTDEGGNQVARGLYFITLRSQKEYRTRKLALLAKP